jgi:hypothetical protein
MLSGRDINITTESTTITDGRACGVYRGAKRAKATSYNRNGAELRV